MSKGIVTADRIKKFTQIAPELLLRLTHEANEKGVYFKAKCEVVYTQAYDLETDKGIGAGVSVQPGVTILPDGAADAEANARVGFTKDREGTLKIRVFEMEFLSKVALASPEDS